jgi:hypothetical protein
MVRRGHCGIRNSLVTLSAFHVEPRLHESSHSLGREGDSFTETDRDEPSLIVGSVLDNDAAFRAVGCLLSTFR